MIIYSERNEQPNNSTWEILNVGMADGSITIYQNFLRIFVAPRSIHLLPNLNVYHTYAYNLLDQCGHLLHLTHTERPIIRSISCS